MTRMKIIAILTTTFLTVSISLHHTNCFVVGSAKGYNEVRRKLSRAPLSFTQGVFLCTLRFCTLGLGSLNHGIRPFIKVLGT